MNQIQLRTVPVDPWRSGGMLSGRNFFSSGPRSPHLRLAQAVPMSDAAHAVIASGIDRAVDALNREMEAVSVEADMVSPPALRVQPDDYTQISLIGTVLAPQEIRSVILADARAIDGQATRVQTGALSHYLSSAQSAALADIRTRAGKIVEYEQGQDLQPVAAEHLSVANSHVDSHLRAPQAAIADAEKAVVAAEAGSVPVLEPSEQTLTKTEIVAGIGVVAGIGILLWTLL